MKEPEGSYRNEEKNNEDLIIIREGYKSSPKCGIKCKIVKNVLRNIIFTPVEISAQPYLKYSVTQLKEDQNNDISPMETDNTKLQEEKSRTYNLSTTNNDEFKLSQIKDKKNDGNSGIYDEENSKNDYNNIHIIEKKESEKTFSLSKVFDEEGNKIDKHNKNKTFFNKEHRAKNLSHHSLKDKDNDKLKIKLNLNNKEDEKKKKKLKNSQRNIYNILNNISNHESSNHSVKANIDNLLKTEENKDSTKTKSIFNFNSINKKNQPIIIKYKRDSMKVRTSVTSTNIKPVKKIKKVQEIDSKKLENKITRQHSHILIFKFKKIKIIHNDEKDKDNKKTKRRSLVPKEENKDNKKENNKSINILSNDKDNIKLKLNSLKYKNVKMKSMGNVNDNKNEILNVAHNNSKKNENEISWTPKRINYQCKIKKEKSVNYGDDNNNNNQNNQNNHNSSKNHIILKTIKGKRRVSFFKENTNESKKKRRLFTEDKKDGSSGAKEKIIFSILKDKDKDKDKEKSYIKDKKLEKKSKKKIKEKKSKKEKEKEKEKGYNNGRKGSVKKIIRKDKSFTIISKLKKNLINEDNSNINKNKLKLNNKAESSNSNKEKNESNEKKISQKPSSSKLNDNEEMKTKRSDVRRNSTRDFVREKNNKEKITELTNKQIIDNINDYTRQCLQIIPELYDLQDKMPRCKTKIHPNLSGNKKIALFDLDETIVHCIGEINMNNVESFSKQSDAKIRVHLPGGKREITIGINIRPHWEEALNKIKKKYHIIAFTASHESYADSVLNHLDPEGKYFEFRLYRCHCVLCIVNEMKFYVKDLKIVEDLYDLKDVVIIDNSVLSFAYHLDNGIPISPFYDSKNDSELLDIADFLVKYANEKDIRDKLKEVYKLSKYMEILKEYNSEEDDESSNNLENEEEEKDEKNNLSTGNKNKTNINLIKPLLVNNINININKENEEAKSNKSKDNNISQLNLKLKEISNMFHSDKKEKKNFIELKKSKKSVSKYLDNSEKAINGNKRREKHKTILLGINFQKEWEEKQKELKNE